MQTIDEALKTKAARWRLILGQDAEARLSGASGGGLQLTAQEELLDQALAAIYNNVSGNGENSGRGAGLGASNPRLVKWLGDIRALFAKDIVTIIQNDAIERKGLKQLLFEPELLERLEPDINLAATLMALKEHIPKRSKENARAFIQKIVAEINRRMENDIRRAVTAALNKRRHSPLPSVAALDYKQTIERNLKNYNPTLKRIIPDHFYFFDRATRTNHWTVIVDIDQSGSMGESVIYSSIMACILASINAIKTHIIAFDTEVVDLTEKSDDPVDLLFGFQLGGGTNINKSIAYCSQFIETPAKTIFFLISDLDEGGNQSGMLRRLEEMKASGVTVVSLLAIADGGKPYYNEHIAGRIAAMGIPCFACTPALLPQLLEAAFKGHDLQGLAKRDQRPK